MAIKFPYVIVEGITDDQLFEWKKFYSPNKDYDPRIEEGIWRRTQSQENAEESNWHNDSDCRRRMVHYRNRFDIAETGNKKNLALVESFLYEHVCLPLPEIEQYKKIILEKIGNNWNLLEKSLSDEKESLLYSCGDLLMKINIFKEHPKDIIEKRYFPYTYRSMDIVIYSKNAEVDYELLEKSWHILKTGFRKKDPRQVPITDGVINRISELFPAQIELGCGPSIEAGIPPLNHLHEIYCVTNLQNRKSNFSYPENKLITGIIDCPGDAFSKMTEMFRKCFTARPTKFHAILKKLSDNNLIIGPVITNNFDGLIRKIGLDELYVRRFKSEHIIPKIKFHPKAKSLIVVGVHADRRKIHQAARKNGLTVVYIDPEGYYNDGKFEQYPLESPQGKDILLKETATAAFEKIYDKLVSKKLINKNMILLSKDPQIQFSGEKVVLPKEIQKKIDQYWDDLIRSGKGFRRGDVFTIANIMDNDGKAVIKLVLSDYAHYLATIHNIIDQKYACRVVHSSVMIKTADDFLVFGEMAGNTALPGRIQCIGGGITRDDLMEDGVLIDIRKNAATEMAEEVGIFEENENYVSSFYPWALVESGPQKALGVVYWADLAMNLEQFLQNYATFVNALAEKNEKPELANVIAIPLNHKRKIELLKTMKKDNPIAEYLPIIFEEL